MFYSSENGTKSGDILIKWNGFKEFEELLDEINDDFGEKDAKGILRVAMKKAMHPVLETARSLLQTHDNIDTGQLIRSLQVEARKPRGTDKHSKYTSPTMIMIARVTVAPGKKFVPDTGEKKLLSKQFKNKKTGEIAHMHSDARAYAIEFGTAKWKKGEGMPFIRPALETNVGTVTNSLVDSLKFALLRYQSKKMTTGK
jgi:hypothetical protein